MFSSVTSNDFPLNKGVNSPTTESYIFFIAMVSCLIPKFCASSSASVTECPVEYCEGINKPHTFSAPRASAANTAVSAESTPPLKPKMAFLNPSFSK